MKINIKVKPHSGKQEIVEINEKEYVIYLKERAEGNKANIELLKLLKKNFKKNVKIIRGLKSRSKIAEVK